MSKETSAGMQLAGNIFNEMVMEEAIKDKPVLVQKLLEDEAVNIIGHNQQAEKDSDSDFNSDGDDDVMRSMRDVRLAALKAKQAQHAEDMANGHGKYSEISEDQFLPVVTKTRFVILHFYHKDFERCKIVDMHLSQIAKQHTETHFVKIDAEKCPFFVAKLQVQMLPTIVCFIDGIAVDRVVGFEELGG